MTLRGIVPERATNRGKDSGKNCKLQKLIKSHRSTGRVYLYVLITRRSSVQICPRKQSRIYRPGTGDRPFLCGRSILMDRYLLELELAPAAGGAAGAATASLISMAQRGNA